MIGRTDSWNVSTVCLLSTVLEITNLFSCNGLSEITWPFCFVFNYKFLIYNAQSDWLMTVFISEKKDTACRPSFKNADKFYKRNIKWLCMSQFTDMNTVGNGNHARVFLSLLLSCFPSPIQGWIQGRVIGWIFPTYFENSWKSHFQDSLNIT